MDIYHESGLRAQLASQALLIFSYRQIKSSLEDMAENPALPAAARKNAIYAIQMYPEKEAVSELVELVSNDNKESF